MKKDLSPKYLSSSSYAKKQTIPISLEKDPRLTSLTSNFKIARQNAEVVNIGNGKSFGAFLLTLKNSSTLFTFENPSQEPSPTGNSPADIVKQLSGTIVYDQVTNLAASFNSKGELVLLWDFDTTANDNGYATDFSIKFMVGTVPYFYKSTVINKDSTSQSFTLTQALNAYIFGAYKRSFTSISVAAEDNYGNIGEYATIAGPTVNTGLTAPTITVTALQNGYSVNVTNVSGQPSDILDLISIEEYVSNDTTEPTGVTYTQVSLGKSSVSQINIYTSTTAKRWVKARFTNNYGEYSAYSTAVAVTPTPVVVVDNTPPAEVGSVSAAWSGDNVVISYSGIAADTVRFQVQLTAPNSLVGYFYFFPEVGNSHTISKADLFLQFGEHYNSFSGILRSIDSADNRSSGVSFNVPLRSNPLASLTSAQVASYFSLTGSANSYAINISLPPYANYAHVYDKTTTWGTGNPTDETYLVASGSGSLVVPVANATDTHYVKIRFYDDFGYTSAYSDEKTVTAYDPGQLSLINNPIKISTNGTIFAGDSATSYPRVYFNKDGIFAYDAGGNQTTQIVNSATNGQSTFKTTRAQIADWLITDYKIENTLNGIPGTTSYTGLSGSGTYAFWAGSSATSATGPTSDSQAEFWVKKDGSVKANNITVTGGSLKIGSQFTVAATTGKLTATDGDFTGRLDVKGSSTIVGNLQVVSGTFYAGTLGGARVAISSAGLSAFDAGGVTQTTSIVANASVGQPTFTTSAAQIGGWTVNASSFQNSAGTFKINSTGSIVITDAATPTYQVQLSAAGNSVGSTVIFSAGAVGQTANFSLTQNGILTATSAILSGQITATSGKIGTVSDGWNISSNSLVSYGTSGGIISAGTISGSAINGATVTGGTIQTSSSSTSRRIVISDSNTSYINFYPSSTDTTSGSSMTVAGYLAMGSGLGYTGNIGLRMSPPTGSGWVTPYIDATASPSVSEITLTASALRMQGQAYFNSVAIGVNGFDVGTGAFRNISAGTLTPSGGNTGDVYIQY